ncbi:MAG: hypothetical protein K2Y08_04410 [Alphaproteobacteria bacterium]|nr:hypothetical protein [Alphaproteobacteria bacterium]
MNIASAVDVIPSNDVPASECNRWAEEQEDPTYKAHAQKRCQAIVDCNENQSDNYNDWHECLFTAESDFQRETAGVVPQGSGMGAETSAVTQPADSTSSRPEREKGFNFSKQGD